MSENMIETTGLSRGSGESSEELSMLPRHTRVVVTGNKRTKSDLVGLHGAVTKAVGLGGWHWLVLTNGVEVKLQRNALTVIEEPTRNEDDDDSVIKNGSSSRPDLASGGTQKSRISRHRVHKSSSSSHMPISTPCSSDSQSKDSVSMPCCGSMKVDLSKLETATLWRYWRHFNLNDDNPYPSREQLVEVAKRHFMSQQLDEVQVIAGFAQAAKRLKTLHK